MFRGVELADDDRLRRDIILHLSCDFALDFAAIEQRYAINFSDYFSDALPPLSAMQTDSLLVVNKQGIQILPAGRLLIRNICMVFDKYLQGKPQQRFSKVI